jgi:2-hydroxychromene-2-carboxylate isomerase
VADVPVVRFWFDVVCPYAYVAACRLVAMEDAGELRIDWCPLLLGGVLRAVGQVDRPMDAMAAPKVAHVHADLQRQATLLGIQLRYPAEHPRRTVDAMRAIVAARPDRRGPLALRLWRAYWADGADLADPEVLGRLVAPMGVDARAIDGARDALRNRTDEAVARGVFGVPTMEVAGRRYWGADRLSGVREALGLPTDEAMPRQPIEVFHDFASPYSYLGTVPLLDAPNVTLRPMLLGALFQAIGTPVVPVAGFQPAKAAWVRWDLGDVARRRGLPFAFTPHFPVRTVDALRVAILEPAATRALYEAVWVHGADVGRRDVLVDVLDHAGFPGEALVDRTADPAVKQALRDHTAAALAAGVPGAPSYVHRTGTYWGQDRLTLLAAMERHGA